MEVLAQLRQITAGFLVLRVSVFAFAALLRISRQGWRGDWLPNVGCGALALGLGRVATEALGLAGILYVASLAPQRVATTWWTFALTLVGADLSFYVYHRLAHRVRLLWADHSVHHSSEELDLSTNLRVSPSLNLYTWFPAVPLLLVGINPYLVILCLGLANNFPFFLHTTRVGKLWQPIELLFNTPSHHRVHHACNAHYRDKNMGGLFIVWDRLFGTFAEEREACVFGSSRPVSSSNPLIILSSEWLELVRELRQASSWSQIWRTLF